MIISSPHKRVSYVVSLCLLLWQYRSKIASSFFYRHSVLNMLQQMFNFAISRLEVCSCSLLLILGKDFDTNRWLLSPSYICICVSSHVICPLRPRKGNEYLWLNQIGMSNQIVLIFAWVRNIIYEDNWDKIKVLYIIRIIAACHHFPCVLLWHCWLTRYRRIWKGQKKMLGNNKWEVRGSREWKYMCAQKKEYL